MPVKIEDGCVDCGKPCIGSACPYRREKHYYCDICGEESDPDQMRVVNGKLVCNDCLDDYLIEEGIIEKVNLED